ncbi:acyl carrier protein [Mycobacterium hackensackense]|uniref:acyl carrier protein n=1 Tax=Mycobacterium hackensackense TaxID=228909 RepID=UPI0022659ECA|nr:acyl carrier protein [Mycobacterium hackensackense]MCV7256870.1 acyl carrier protein [Mycobacterium hackensackense]
MSTNEMTKTVLTAEITDAVLAWLRNALDDPDIGPDDNFLDVGGNSRMSMKVRHEVRVEFGASLDPVDLFQLTIAQAIIKATDR